MKQFLSCGALKEYKKWACNVEIRGCTKHLVNYNNVQDRPVQMENRLGSNCVLNLQHTVWKKPPHFIHNFRWINGNSVKSLHVPSTWGNLYLLKDISWNQKMHSITMWKLRKILAAPYTVVWKTRNSLIETFFRQINFLVIYLVKHLLSRNFCKKMWKRISAISTPQCGKSQNLLSPKIFLVKSTI